MTRPAAPPRTANYMGMVSPPIMLEKDTWLEAESFCYPGGGMNRRARAVCPDGKLRIFACGIPDTFFSIPVKGGGWLGLEGDVLQFHPKKSS